METRNLKVEGMTCGHCQMAVTRALEGVPGVLAAQVSLEGAQATVSYEPALVGLEQLVAAVDEAGYKLVVSA